MVVLKLEQLKQKVLCLVDLHSLFLLTFSTKNLHPPNANVQNEIFQMIKCYTGLRAKALDTVQSLCFSKKKNNFFGTVCIHINLQKQNSTDMILGMLHQLLAKTYLGCSLSGWRNACHNSKTVDHCENK